MLLVLLYTQVCLRVEGREGEDEDWGRRRENGCEHEHMLLLVVGLSLMVVIFKSDAW